MNRTAHTFRAPAPWLALLVAVLFAVYWPGLGGGYVFDDFANIVDNTRLHVNSLRWHDWVAAMFSSDAGPVQRPLAMLSFAANHALTGLDPAPMKLTNIAIHTVNAVLVLGLLRQLLALAPLAGLTAARREWAVRFAGAAWALHPINLLAVLFIVQRMESLAHTFLFAGLWLYLAGRQRQLAGTNGWSLMLAGLAGGTGLGLLAKESAVLLPMYAFAVELCLLGFRTAAGGCADRRLLWMYGALLVLPAIAGLSWVLPKLLASSAWAHRDFTLTERLLTEARVVVDYLRWTLSPSLRELSLYHDDYVVSRGLLQPPGTLLALAFLAALAAFVAWIRPRRPLLALGLLWFVSAHLLTATVFPLELVHEHRNYFASLGICLALADVLLLAPRDAPLQRGGAMLAGIALVAFALTTHLRAREWSDPYRFAITEAAKHPQSPRATYALGHTLSFMTHGDPNSPLLEPTFGALERARTVPESGVLPAHGLLILAAKTKRPLQDAWWNDIETHFRERPFGVPELGALRALTACAIDADCTLPVAPMMRLFITALSRGEDPELLSIYGNFALNVLGDTELALKLWSRAVELAPRQSQYQISLARLLIALGREEEARQRIDALRALGRIGQNEREARALESRMRAARSPRADVPQP